MRQSMLRARSASGGGVPHAAPHLGPTQGPAGPAASIPARTKPLAHGAMHGGPAGAMPSLSAMMSSPTGTIEGRARPRRPRGVLARTLLVLLVLGGSGALTFAIVTMTRTETPAGAATATDAAVIAQADPRTVRAEPARADAAIAASPPDALDTPGGGDATERPAPPDAPPLDASPPPGEPPSRRPKVKQPPVAAPETRHGKLVVRAFPALTIYVGGKVQGDTPRDLKLPVGKHTLRLRNAEIGHDETVTIEILENTTTTIERMK